MRVNRDFGLNDQRVYRDGQGNYHTLAISTPTTDLPDDDCLVDLWNDWGSDSLGLRITAGSVIPVNRVNPMPLPSSFTVDFYDE